MAKKLQKSNVEVIMKWSAIIITIIVIAILATNRSIRGFVAGPISASFIESTPTPTPLPPIKINAIFISPNDGQDVDQIVVVNGKYENVPEDKILWLYRFPTGEMKYYLNQVDLLKDGTWRVKDVYIGEVKGAGTYKLGIIAISQQDSNDLQGKTEGLNSLPPSVERLNEITVYRK